MGNVIGSCAGSCAGTCAVACVGGGDLSTSPHSVTDILDSILTITPIFFTIVSRDSELNFSIPTSFLWFYLLGTLLVQMCLLFAGEPRKFFGARLVLPFVVSLASVWIPIPDILSFIAPAATAALAAVGTVCFSDMGFRLNQFVRESFEFIHATYWLLILYQIILVGVSGGVIVFAVNFFSDWKYFVFVSIITILAVWDFPTVPSSHRGSIMSVALFVGGIVAILTDAIPIEISIALFAIYNNCILNEDGGENTGEGRNETTTPLLRTTKDVTDAPCLSTTKSHSEFSKFFFNSLLCIAQFLCVGGSSSSLITNQQIYCLTALSLYVWIIIAPVVLTNRAF